MGGEHDSGLLAPKIPPWTEEAMCNLFHRTEIESTQNIIQQEQLWLRINGPSQRLCLVSKTGTKRNVLTYNALFLSSA
jgi:hypothetical protein